MAPMSPRRWNGALLIAAALAGACGAPGALAAPARGPTLPEIRVSAHNARGAGLRDAQSADAHLLERTRDLDPRFRDIARYYKLHGDALGIRWDYAFYQMLLETNYLSYKTGSGRRGDVDPRQNNFAGIGTTGGGVPGDSFPDVSTGVLAQMQHLIAYSGERVAKPVAPRTREEAGRDRRTVQGAAAAGALSKISPTDGPRIATTPSRSSGSRSVIARPTARRRVRR